MENDKNACALSFGGEASKEDYRTVKAEPVADTAVATLPTSGKVNLNFNYVNDLSHQKKIGICTKCGTRMAEEEFHRDGVRLSEYWGYLMGKTLIDDPTYNYYHFEGSSALTMLKCANKFGTPTKAMEIKYPLKTDGTYAEFIGHFRNTYGGKIPAEIIQNALLHKIPGYYKVKVEPRAIAKEIAAGRVLVARLSVGDNFYKDKNGTFSWNKNDLLPLRAPKSVDSGHIMAMNEYKGLDSKQVLSGPNSWGITWADKGYYNFVFNVQAPYYFTEVWAISDLPVQVINDIKDLPEAKDFQHRFQTNIEYGMKGSEVRALQIALSILGFLNIHVGELGVYGPKTARAVLDYQKSRKLLPDAQLDVNGGQYVHRLTINALNKDFTK